VAISAATIALFLSAPAAFADAQPNGATPVATAGQVTPSTSDTTTTTTSTTDTGTPVLSQSTLGPSTVTTDGPATQQGDAPGSASPGSDTGNGTLTIIVSSASNPDSTGSPPTATGPPGGSSTTTNTTDTTPTTDTSGTTPTTVDNPPSSNSQSAQGEADTTQTGAQNGNVSTRVDHGGDTGQVTQGNNANASASGTATGDIPATGTDPSGNAAATTNQDSPSNSNVAVRVDSPGDISGVDQQNHSSANSSSGGPTGSAGSGGGNATADASQTAPGNVNVVVRVGSPGDNGDVNQQNLVDATAGPNANAAPPAGTATSGPAQTDQVTATTNGGAGHSNSGTVDQQLIQTQDGDGPDVDVSGNPAVDQAASSSTGSATATQTGAKNVNVSVRIGSPGIDGTVTQANGASATGTSPDLSVAKVVDASNLNLSIVLPGGTAVAPGADWNWNWTWTGDGTPPAGATADGAAPTTGPNWTWLWSQTPATTAAASVTTTGFFTWDWTWTMTDGTVWSLHEQQACTCNWTWTWNWDWSKGAPTSTPPAADSSADDGGAAPGDGSYDDGPVSQDNTVTAVADASVALTQTGLLSVDQTGVDPSLELQDAENGQSFANTQNAIAFADAEQLHPTNLNMVWGVPVAKVSQSNFVEADAEAHATVTLDQELIQGQDGAPDTYQWVGAQQTTTNDQQIAAGAQAIQDSAGNWNIVSAPAPNHAAVAAVEQANTAVTTAAANAVATLYQGLAQFEDASAGGVELTDLSQLIDSYQYSLVASTVTQTRTRNVDYLLVPAGSRATNPTVRQRNDVIASATGWNMGDLSSTSFQYQGGAADLEVTSGAQEIHLSQSGTAYAPASQSNLLNYATWRGVEPPLPGGDGGDQGGDTQPVTSAASVPAVGGLVFVYGPFTTSPHIAPGPKTRFLPPALRTLPNSVGGGVFVPPVFAEGTAPIIPRAGPASSTFTPPVSGFVPEPSTGSSVVVQLQSGTTTVATAIPVGPERIPAPLPPGDPDNPFSAGAGASASAPSSGGGQTAIAFGPYKLAAQLVTAPQMSASALGRPVIFLEPFERPG
jgi:hypothetical protein